MIHPCQINVFKLWISTEDLTSTTNVNRKKVCEKSHRSKYFISFTVEGRLESFKDQGFSISHNPSGDVDCQFSALSYLLQKIGIHIVSSFGSDARTLIQPQKFEPIGTFYLGHFVEGGGEHYVTLDRISSNIVNFDITTDGGNNVDTGNLDVAAFDTVNLDVAADDADNDDAVALGADNDNIVDLNVAANDSVDPGVAADDAVSLDLAANGANSNNRTYLDVVTNQP